ncbi:Snt309p [Saccharomyces paradoxus]|uniref:Snt309p n=1 Tax=Saccharomyces paradoxus TaxID=27291 RepID=A0A8B8V1K3_SACPA|nr:Snt309 [Saccharomyces paradoxus]QHS76814.1 Snt309 [Saccharomyces paradoxus]
MDRFNFIDKGILEIYKSEIDELVRKEYGNIKKEPMHPEVQGIITKKNGPDKSVTALSKGLYTEYLEQCNNKKKRASDFDDDVDTLFLQEYRRKYPRIDTSRYVPNESSEINLLGMVDSYLKHQEIVLDTLLPRTISNQWMINNDHIQQTSTIVEEMSDQQQKHINDLEIYREGLQRRYEPLFLQMRRQIEER